jgi:hypothetical protein
MSQLTIASQIPSRTSEIFGAISSTAVAGLTRSPPFPYTGEFHETGVMLATAIERS